MADALWDRVSYPLLLAPRTLEKPWGGRRIELALRRRLEVEGPVGELWEVFDREGASSVVRNGALAGRSVADLRGDKPFPLLVKTLDASQSLSVQVHPDEDAARKLGGEAKSEAWFVLHAEPGAKVWRGLREGVGERELRESLARGTIEDCLHAFSVSQGDTVFVPAGTVHSIGAGIVLAEVQQNSDSTYRLWDFGRARKLHVESALASIRFGPRGPDKVPAQILSDDGQVQRALLIQCRHFTAESVAAMGTFTLDVPHAGNGVPAVLHILAGSGEIRPFRRGVAPVPFAPGDTLLLPPQDEEFEIAPGATVLRALMFRG